MPEQSATQTILDWIYATRYEDIPQVARRGGLLALYDGVGSNLACSLLPVAHRTVDFVKLVGGPPDCSVIGFPDRTSVVNAATVIGTLDHADEIDAVEPDVFGAHITAACIGAGLSTGQLVGASGKEVLRGLIIGYELSKRTHRVAAYVAGHRTHLDAGNTVGATAAAGISLGLSRDEMEVALCLGASMACGLTPWAKEREHMLKSYVRGGVGARNGVDAALMAKAGYDAPGDIFDGSEGFFGGRTGSDELGPELLAGLGTEYSIQNVIFKRACGGHPFQGLRLGFVELMADNGLSADDIAEVLVEVRPGTLPIATVEVPVHPNLKGKEIVAVAAIYGGTGFMETHNERYYRSPEAMAMQDRINIIPKEEWGEEDEFSAIVTIRTKDGRELRRPSRERRMTEEDLDAKFADLVGMRVGEAKDQELSTALKEFETVKDVSEVMTQLEMPAMKVEGF